MKHIHTLAAALVLSLAGSAMAQSGTEDFKKPLKAAKQPKASKNTSSKSTTVMRQDDGENTVEVRIDGDHYSAKVNGEEVPTDRIVREGDEVRVQDKNGKTLSTFHMAAGGGPAKVPAGGTWSVGPGGAVAQGNPPKVMIGITMDAPSEELLKNYSLKEGEAILVSRVIDGLPADKAGLKENDLITEIDGKKPASQETLREVLKGKEPGDTVQVTVLRKGGDKSLRITLDKFDQDKLGTGAWTINGMPGEGGATWFNQDGNNGDANEAMKEAEKAMKDAMRGGKGFQTFRLPGNAQGKAFVMGGGGADTDKKLAELDDKMADLDKKLQHVNDQISKLQELIQKLTEQRGR